MSKYGNHFTSDELECRCGCGICFVNMAFFRKIKAARATARLYCIAFRLDPKYQKFHVTSCCRCEEHNRAVGGVENSKHICLDNKHSAHAIDLHFVDRIHLSILVGALISEGLTHIGINMKKEFIHVDDAAKGMFLYP